MKICVDCKHHINTMSNPAVPDVWYNQVCSAVSRERATDPVTGKRGFADRNDLGLGYVTDQEHPYCRNINKHGRCNLFEPRNPE